VLPREATPALVPVSELAFSSAATRMLPIALSEVLGISLSEVMKKYFEGASSADEVDIWISEDVDRRIDNGEDELWLAKESRRLEDQMEHDHQGEDDTF
jgi:hypothetical protein